MGDINREWEKIDTDLHLCIIGLCYTIIGVLRLVNCIMVFVEWLSHAMVRWLHGLGYAI